MHQKKIVLTRYIDVKRISYIFHGAAGAKKNQKISEFHDQMNAVKCLRIDDLNMGNYFAPSGIELNRLYCQAGEFDVAYESVQSLNNATKLKATEFDLLNLSLCHINNENAAARDCLTNIGYIQYGINQRKLDAILPEYDDWNGLAQQRENIAAQVREMELSKCLRTNLTSRTKRIDNLKSDISTFTDHLVTDTAKTSNLKKVYSEMVELYTKMKEQIKEYVVATRNRSEKELALFENDEMQKMYRRLKYQENDVPTHIKDCEYGIKEMNKTKARIFDLEWFERNEKIKASIKNWYAKAEQHLESLQPKLRPLQILYNRWNEDAYEE